MRKALGGILALVLATPVAAWACIYLGTPVACPNASATGLPIPTGSVWQFNSAPLSQWKQPNGVFVFALGTSFTALTATISPSVPLLPNRASGVQALTASMSDPESAPIVKDKFWFYGSYGIQDIRIRRSERRTLLTRRALQANPPAGVKPFPYPSATADFVSSVDTGLGSVGGSDRAEPAAANASELREFIFEDKVHVTLINRGSGGLQTEVHGSSPPAPTAGAPKDPATPGGTKPAPAKPEARISIVGIKIEESDAALIGVGGAVIVTGGAVGGVATPGGVDREDDSEPAPLPKPMPEGAIEEYNREHGIGDSTVATVPNAIVEPLIAQPVQLAKPAAQAQGETEDSLQQETAKRIARDLNSSDQERQDRARKALEFAVPAVKTLVERAYVSAAQTAGDAGNYSRSRLRPGDDLDSPVVRLGVRTQQRGKVE